MGKLKTVHETVAHGITRYYRNITKAVKLPHVHFSPRLPIIPIKLHFPFPHIHKGWILGSILLAVFAAFIIGAIHQGYFMAVSKTAQKIADNQLFNATPNPTSDNALSPTMLPSPTNTSVLGASTISDMNTVENNIPTSKPYPTSMPTYTPYPTQIPLPTSTPTNTTTSNNSANPNCTTGAGVPNSWYSDVYPNPPISTTNGSQTLVVDIRDCSKNIAPVSDTITISLSSGDSNTQINGNNLPYSTTTQNGQASFTVIDQTAVTDTFIIKDTTSSFTITDINNNNPSVTFAPSSSPTPALTPTPSPISTPTPTLNQITTTPTPTASQTVTSTPTPTLSPTPTITH